MISRYFSMINSGKPEYLKEVFKLYDIKLKLGFAFRVKSDKIPFICIQRLYRSWFETQEI